MLPASVTSSKVAQSPTPHTPPNVKENSPAETAAGEKAASFNEPEKEQTTTANDNAVEPATFNAPNAAPVKSDAATPISIKGAPIFTSSELSAALQAAKDAEANLVNGNLSDGREVARMKGFSYSILADLAQKLTFTPESMDVTDLKMEGKALFRKILSNEHARQEIAQIVPKWIASPNRRQGGVFFAGSVTIKPAADAVSEIMSVDLVDGEKVPVLVPTTAVDQAQGSTPVAIVGYIVDRPAERVPGYTGDAPRAIFAKQLLPLQ
jgi:hypothetical protein